MSKAEIQRNDYTKKPSGQRKRCPDGFFIFSLNGQYAAHGHYSERHTMLVHGPKILSACFFIQQDMKRIAGIGLRIDHLKTWFRRFLHCFHRSFLL